MTAEYTRHHGPILVVDDDAEIRDTLRDCFEEEGFSVVVAANGKDALEQISTGPRPCVVVLDLMMPVMDGHQFSVELQRRPETSVVPIVVITAGQSPAGPAMTNAFRVFRKPFKVSELLTAIHACC